MSIVPYDIIFRWRCGKLDGMNIKKSSWRVRERAGLVRGNGGAGAWVLLAHGQCGGSLGRWIRPALRTPKAKCHLSASQKGTGRCLRTATGEGLLRMVVVARLDGAWAPGCFGAVGAAVDMVDGMDTVDARDLKDGKDQRDERLRLAQGQRVVWPARTRPLSRSIQPYLGVSRSVPLFRKFFARCLSTRAPYYGATRGGIWAPIGRTGNEFRPGWFAQMPAYAALCLLVPPFFRKFYSGACAWKPTKARSPY